MMTGFGMALGGGLVMVLFWVALMVGAVWLFGSLVSRANSQPAADSPPAESALDILNKRYVRGEITKEQFDEMRRDLNV